MCFGNPFSEEMSYKENYLIRASIEKGREILILAPTEKFVNGRVVRTNESDSNITNNVRLIRMNYERVVNKILTEKYRKSSRFMTIVLSFKPDVIFFNTIQVYNILDCKEIKDKLPKTRILADVSSDYGNSAQNFISKEILHRLIYKRWIQRSLPFIDRVFYVAESSRLFLSEIYRVSDDKMEFSPLCAEIFSRENKIEKKNKFCARHSIDDGTLILSHSGKMNNSKKTIELLQAFRRISNIKWRLFIAGKFEEDIEKAAQQLISEDPRVTYLGFLDLEGLTDMLCASDLYVQPYSPSQTAQTAMGCLTPVLFARIQAYVGYEESGGIFIDSTEQLFDCFKQIHNKAIDLDSLSQKIEKFAEKYLNYITIEERLFLNV